MLALAAFTPVAAPGHSAPAAAQAKAAGQQHSAQARQLANNARDFHTRNPGDPRAAQARKMEAIGGLRGVSDGEADQAQAALALAAAFRDDTTNAAGDRCDVALEMERLKLSVSGRAQHAKPSAAAKADMADQLRAEFGDQPQLHDYYLQVARSADMATAKRIATNLLQWPVAAETKAEAQFILARFLLLGRPLALSPVGLDGKPYDLAQLHGGVTVLCVWAAAAGPDPLKVLGSYRQSLPPGVQVAYLAIGGSPLQADLAFQAAPVRGPMFHLPPAHAKAAVDHLKLRHGPYLYVLNREARVAGFGPVGELPNLVAAALR